MPRNASGTYSLPAGNPVSSGTLIESNWANSTLSDIAAEITDSLSRSGEGGMLAPLRFADGSVGAPGFAWLNETSTGFYRFGSGDMRVTIQGVDVGVWTSNGLSIPSGKTLAALGNATVAGTLGVTGNTTVSGTLGVTGAITATGGVVGNVTGNVSGNAGTVTNGVYTTGDQTIGGAKRFSGSITAGGSNVPAANLDVQTTGANVLSSFFTTGLTDLNFRLGAANGVAGSSGSSQAKFGLFYLGVGEAATIDFRRGASSTDGSFAFRTSGNDRATLDNSGNFTATGNVTAYSDERLKKDWADLAEDFIAQLAKVKVGTYTRIDTGERQIGVSAQSLQPVTPEAVTEGEHLSVAYGNAALAACVMLARRVQELEAKLGA